MSSGLVIARDPPCTAACPAGINVQGYVGAIAQGRFRMALDVVREALPFPGICGRVCPAPCEAVCEREPHGGAIAIRALKRFIADVEMEQRFRWTVPPVAFPERIAVIGSGPAGLTAALELRRLGYGVSVLEAGEELGGMLTACLPDFRLPRDIIRYEIEAIANADIDVRCGVRVGRDVSLPELLEQGYGAAIVATGAHRPVRLGISHDDADGVIDAIGFLGKTERSLAGKRVLVIGGGSTAMDAARTAIRLGCEEARVLYRRGRAEMPAAVEEVEQGLQEGVILQTQIVPSRVLVIGAKVTGLGCRRTKPGEPDASGRRRPVVIEGSDFEASGDLIIVAAGQQTDPTVFSKLEGLLQQNGKLKVDPDTLQTTQKKIFGAGDTVTGPATVIEAVAQGRQAAQSIHRLLRDGTTRRSSPGSGGLNGVLQLDGSSRDFSPRIALPLRPERHSSFAESELCLDPGAAMTEAARCLKCGSCSSCRLCWSACRWSPRAIEPSEPEPFARVERQLLDVESAGTRMKITEAPADATALASLVCTVRADRCRGCGMCKDACAFDAVQLEAGVARMDPALCRGCGICAGECPSGAVDAGPMDDAALRRQMRDARGASIVIRCQWCEPAQDNDAVEIRVPCAGRVSAGLVLYALAQGVPRVTVAACAEDRCKYGRGPHLVSERLSWLLACEPERVRQLGKAPCPA